MPFNGSARTSPAGRKYRRKVLKKNVRLQMLKSFLEGLDFRSEAGQHAVTLMPPDLKKGRDDILDYDQRLLGRKWPTDDRE